MVVYFRSMEPQGTADTPDYGIVFFDGYCHLCNGWVSFLLRRRNARRLRFAPLEGTTAAKYLTAMAGPQPESIVYLRNQRVYDQSDAVLQICHDLGRGWRLVWILAVIPRFIRNYFYRIIARNRYRWFGKSETCRLPTAGERQWFLD